MNPTIITYVIYLLLSIALTIWVARTLHRNGRLFLVDCFHGNEPLADSVNHLLVVGFYLLNFGFVSYVLKVGVQVPDAVGVFETLSSKMGIVTVALGGMHFFNIFLFHRLRRNALLDQEVRPPAQPTFIKPLA
jgi:hypothetical protein